jgi:hypothetical protein
MRRRLAGVAVAVGIAISVGALALAQQGQRVPGPGSGVVTVKGAVDVGNSPSVRQEGDWKTAITNTPSVNVTNTPAVNVAPPAFVKVGLRYQIVWSAGETEQVTAAVVGPGGWVRVTGPERGINLDQARSVTTLQ